MEILLDHITIQNDRTVKILDFHSVKVILMNKGNNSLIIDILQPEQLKEVIDFGIPEDPLNLDQLLVDCKDTLKYQVKTGRT